MSGDHTHDDHTHGDEFAIADDINYPPFSEQPQHPSGVGYLAKKLGVTDQFGFFAFIKAVYNERFYEEEWAPDQMNGIRARCDSSAPRSMPMPTDFHVWDYENEVCLACGSRNQPYGTTNSHVASLNNSKILRMPVQSQYGFVTYIEIDDRELEKQAFIDPQNCARTLQELFRLMLEWQWAYAELGNTEEIAKVANDLINDLNMPDDVREWLWNEVPESRVFRYLKGGTSARERADVDTIPSMSESFEKWCLRIILARPLLWRYGTV
jgi:hypothetical protein